MALLFARYYFWRVVFFSASQFANIRENGRNITSWSTARMPPL